MSQNWKDGDDPVVKIREALSHLQLAERHARNGEYESAEKNLDFAEGSVVLARRNARVLREVNPQVVPPTPIFCIYDFPTCDQTVEKEGDICEGHREQEEAIAAWEARENGAGTPAPPEHTGTTDLF